MLISAKLDDHFINQGSKHRMMMEREERGGCKIKWQMAQALFDS